MIATLSSGHIDLADWLLLIAAILFVLAAVATYVRQAVPRDVVPTIVPLGLAFVATALLVL